MRIATEATKFGMTLEEVKALLAAENYPNFENIQIVGVMGMATFTNDLAQVSNEFQRLKAIFEALKGDYFKNDDAFKEISMGMSSDYELAIEEGSTMVRIGSLLFGSR